MPTIKSLSTLRYVSAAVFFAALCNLNYRQQPAFAAYCQDFGGNKKVIFEGPNGGPSGPRRLAKTTGMGRHQRISAHSFVAERARTASHMTSVVRVRAAGVGTTATWIACAT